MFALRMAQALLLVTKQWEPRPGNRSDVVKLIASR